MALRAAVKQYPKGSRETRTLLSSLSAEVWQQESLALSPLSLLHQSRFPLSNIPFFLFYLVVPFDIKHSVARWTLFVRVCVMAATFTNC